MLGILRRLPSGSTNNFLLSILCWVFLFKNFFKWVKIYVSINVNINVNINVFIFVYGVMSMFDVMKVVNWLRVRNNADLKTDQNAEVLTQNSLKSKKFNHIIQDCHLTFLL